MIFATQNAEKRSPSRTGITETLKVRFSRRFSFNTAEISFMVPAGDPKRFELAKKHYRKRAKVIARSQDAIDRHLGYAKHETLRKVEKHLSVQKDRKSNAGGVTNFVGATVNALTAINAGVAADFMFDLEQWSEGLFAALRNESADALQTAGDELFQEIQRDDPWSMPDPLAKQFLEARRNLLRDVPPEIFDQVKAAIQEGLDAGDSIRDMSKRITKVFNDISAGRATTIASTETGAAYGFARQEAMKKAAVQFKGWLTSHLPNVRHAHWVAERDPQNARVPVDEPFMVGGEELMHPGDPAGSPENVINCHCVSLAVA